MENTKKRDGLWLCFFVIIFINGFEAAGYQASLWDIGQTYDMSTTLMGLFASVELFATMLAPLVLGAWADRHDKIFCLKVLLSIQFASSFLIYTIINEKLFVFGTFFLGLTTSATQFISIAALTDYYPVTGKKKIGLMTSMYAFGAFIAPLVVSFYLKRGFEWRTLFMVLTVGSLLVFAALAHMEDGPRELPEEEEEKEVNGNFILAGIMMLCVVMCIYVGFENGFAFFVDSLFIDEFSSSIGKYALSIFWIVMIPSRIMVGILEKHSYKILLTSVIAIPCITVIISMLTESIQVFLLCIPLGIFCGAIYPSVLTILVPLAGKKSATATGMITTATGLGGFVFTALTGFMGDRFGLRGAMVFLAACFILSFFAVIRLRRLKK